MGLEQRIARFLYTELTTRGRINATVPPTEVAHQMKYFPLLAMPLLLCSCTPQSGGGYDATYQQQVDDYNRQSATTDRQLQQSQKQLDQTQEQQDETGRQLERSKMQSDRFDALLDRWEEQADRQDKVLGGLERLLSTQDIGSESGKTN